MMSRNSEYQFIPTDTRTLVSELVGAYEAITKSVVHPASPEKLFISWVADIVVQERVLNNYTGNQNIPSRAEGENLDALGELFHGFERPVAQAAKCMVRIYISAAQGSAILIPSRTRMTDTGNTLIWQTTVDVYIPAGDLFVETETTCQTSGLSGNGYEPGQINTMIDLFDYYDRCENITKSDGGANEASDEEYYSLMRASQDAYSTAGAKGGYVYFAKRVSTEIEDVVANSPTAGEVNLYVIMNDGSIASEGIKSDVLAACNPDSVRPLTDHVVVRDPEIISYNISFTYYIYEEMPFSSTELQAAVTAAVNKYVTWQAAKLGRDINPSHLIGLLMDTGIKRVVLSAPLFTSLRDGSENDVPQIASADDISITNGGYEDD